MIENENGRVSGSVDRSRVAELLAQTDDEDLKAHYRELLGESEEGKAASGDAGEQSEDVATNGVNIESFGGRGVVQPAEDVDLDDLRAQAEALGVKVDGRWGEQRLRDEIVAAQESEDADGDDDLP